MIPRSNRHKYVVKELPYDLSQLQLGNCTEAYDDKADRSVSAIVWWCIILLLTLCAGIATIKEIPLFSIGAGAALLLEILGLLHSIKQRHRSQRLYVFEQGLVLDRIDHSKNTVLKRQVINFAQVSYIFSRKRRNYSSNSNDDMTDEHYSNYGMPTETSCSKSAESTRTSKMSRNCSHGFGLQPKQLNGNGPHSVCLLYGRNCRTRQESLFLYQNRTHLS